MNKTQELFVIINQRAARARAAWPVVRQRLTQSGLRFDAHEAKQKGDAQAQARAALRRGALTVAVVGGDGTLSEVASGFFACDEHCDESSLLPSPVNAEAALAILPGGTGNDFARGLDRQRASLECWLERLIAHGRHVDENVDARDTTRLVDVLHGRVSDNAHSFICLNAATLGIGAQVAGRVATQRPFMRRLPGEARFGIAALAALIDWRLRRVRIRVDGAEAVECATNLIAVVNSPYAGGGMMFSPDARVDDGRLDVVTACDIPRAVILRELARIHTGRHLANPRVRLLRGTHVRIENLTPADALLVEADGDVRGHTPLEFRVMPRALRVVV